MCEIWKDIAGFENSYMVSNLGNIKSKERSVIVNDNPVYERHLKEKILKPELTRGYYTVGLHKDGKLIKLAYVHRLVAEAFLPNPNNLPQINHKDENPKNNCVDNLEWCTCNYNNNYGTKLIRQSLNTRGEKHFRYKKHLSEEHKLKISKALMGNKNRAKRK